MARTRYGIGEWYGHVLGGLAGPQLNDLSAKAKLTPKTAAMPCPFKQAAESDALCSKRGGVCSMQAHRENDAGQIELIGDFVTMCPARFWQDNDVFRWIGETVLGTSAPTLIKEVDFLESVLSPDADPDEEAEAVGRIDLVLLDPDNPRNWCATELQAVYFSGRGMSSHLDQYAQKGVAGPLFPDLTRRPDFRSSGPKRLMPQLQTKVPTLRRWGKKMVVVVDRPFFASLGPIQKVPHLSNADIAWFVVAYEPSTGKIGLHEMCFTTLENSVEALTAGIPTSREQFEDQIGGILTAETVAAKKKVIRLKKNLL